MTRSYLPEDCNLELLRGSTIAVIGYGIQGRAHALNLRDSGLTVIVGNREDDYRDRAVADGFEVYDIAGAASRAEVMLLLVPDEAQAVTVSQDLLPHLTSGKLITVAHGYSVRYSKVRFPEGIDVALLAPRFPGEQVRKYYVEGRGAPAFIDVIQDATGTALARALAVGLALGFAKAGLLHVSYQQETDIDLFVEHFVAPLFFRTMEESLSFLVSEGYDTAPAVLELYFSGERGAFWSMVGRDGIYNALRNNASPTCQFGIATYIETIYDDALRARMRQALEEIRNGDFARWLEKEEAAQYPTVRRFYDERGKGPLSRAEDQVRSLIKDKQTLAFRP